MWDSSTNEGVVACISKDPNDTRDFYYLLNEINKDLIRVVIQDEDDYDPPFSEAAVGDEYEKYYISMNTPEYTLMFLFITDDGGYLWFRLINDNGEKGDEGDEGYRGAGFYHHSLFRISVDDTKKLEQYFENLDKEETDLFGKPVLYLYPEKAQDVNVILGFDGRLTATYPAYNGAWNVRAYPDGRLINHADGLEYSYLFWEGVTAGANWDFDRGYCVAGADTAGFLRGRLGKLGLTPREYNEFIVHWLPQMQDNPYNLITFQHEEYERIAPLTITPPPDSVLRVFMVFAPLDAPLEILPPDETEAFIREGFTAVEWGGTTVTAPVPLP